MKAARPQHASRLEFVEIQDFSQIGVFDDIMEGIDGVIHVASVRHNPPFPFLTLIPSNEYENKAIHIRYQKQRTRTHHPGH